MSQGGHVLEEPPDDGPECNFIVGELHQVVDFTDFALHFVAKVPLLLGGVVRCRHGRHSHVDSHELELERCAFFLSYCWRLGRRLATRSLLIDF